MSTIDNLPLVSVFILCYNHEKYVAESIESVLNQTYSHLELVIVDNASTDNSRTIIESYVQKDSRIRFFSMEYNTFPSYGSNYAIQQCNGEYICGLSADDSFVKQKIEIQLQYMLENNFNNSFTWVKVVDDNENELFGHWADKLFNRHFSPYALENFFITHGNTLCAITWMFHKSMFDKYGYFDNRLLQTQDFDLWLRILSKEPINIIDKKLTYYRVRDDGSNLSIGMDKRADLRLSFEALHFMRRVFEFDLKVLTHVTSQLCNHENKYKHLFNYYRKNNQLKYATAVLFAVYEKLGNDFRFPSNLYLDFLDMYSSFNFLCLDSRENGPLFLQLFLDHGNGFKEESALMLPVAKNLEMQEFVFDLSDSQPFYALRLDPLNDSCVIEIENLRLIHENGETDMLPYINANTITQHGKSFFFEFQDPQIYFNDFSVEKYLSIKALVVALRFEHIGRDAAHACVQQLSADKSHIQHMLEQVRSELSSVYSSKSYKVIKLLRTIRAFL